MTTRGPGDARSSDADAVELLRRIVEIPSPSYHEDAVARVVVEAMRALGMKAHVDGAGNAIGEIDHGPGPTVMLLSHLDTAGEHLPASIDNGRLSGRGAVDAKGPLAAMITAAARSGRLRGRLLVVGAVEEETPGSRGATAIRHDQTAPDALIVGEPSGWSTVVLGYRGKLDLRYEVTTPSTHPTNPAANAAELAAGCWAHLLDLLGPDAGHGVFGRPGASLDAIEATPVRAMVEMSVRTPPGFDDRSLVRQLEERLPSGELELVSSVRACRSPRNDPVVRALTAAVRATGTRPRSVLKTATSDMNTLAEAWSIPMATYGPGDSTLCHSDQESIRIGEYLAGIGVLTHAIQELCA